MRGYCGIWEKAQAHKPHFQKLPRNNVAMPSDILDQRKVAPRVHACSTFAVMRASPQQRSKRVKRACNVHIVPRDWMYAQYAARATTSMCQVLEHVLNSRVTTAWSQSQASLKTKFHHFCVCKSPMMLATPLARATGLCNPWILQLQDCRLSDCLYLRSHSFFFTIIDQQLQTQANAYTPKSTESLRNPD